MVTVHAVAQSGFGKGTNELYDKARPSYQPYVLSHIRNAVKGEPLLNIVERVMLGAGTGIFTRALLAHPDWASSIKSLRAIEPSEGMREVFSKSVNDERVTVTGGTFDTANVEDGWADLVVVAQAFHWCPDYDQAAAEFARILKPDGVVVLVWNLEDREGASWVAQLRDRYEFYEQGTPQFRLDLWRQVFDTPSYQKHFKPHEEKKWQYKLTSDLNGVVNRAFSKSYISVLPDEEKAAVKSSILDIVHRGDDLVWVDKEAGVFEYPYRTLVVVASKRQ
ncbi:S-adenosyl-L-methionine-dependent methyltransferase [Pleurotus eryngii]|uniref:S-adenosyl-L-methionine-dependent methyltransferase n=1 Tax=Pleurotus eryngii TaxID=5323 RepID=A0A9P6DBT5_PLEER|nr:S-adenosyl-L-methionine-dependent methyltransferase [Pleurotus eryngii]